jgi:biotin transport system substrate-specific component
MSAAHSHPTLVDRYVAFGSPAVRNIALAVLGSAALAVSARIQVPFYPVPITLQTFVVLFIGAAFGWRLGGTTVLLYLLEGAAGLPVFAGTPEKGIGMAYMLGTTGGYLVGYVAAAALVGFLAERGWNRRILGTAAAMVLGNTVIYAFGLVWLGTVVGWDKPVLQWGMTPFLVGDLIKIGLASALLPLIWKNADASPKHKD